MKLAENSFSSFCPATLKSGFMVGLYVFFKYLDFAVVCHFFKQRQP